MGRWGFFLKRMFWFKRFRFSSKPAFDHRNQIQPLKSLHSLRRTRRALEYVAFGNGCRPKHVEQDMLDEIFVPSFEAFQNSPKVSVAKASRKERKKYPGFTDGNRLTIFTIGDDYFQSVFQAINNAKTRIWMEIYILEPDRLGFTLLNNLLMARKRGVEVFMVYDAIGSAEIEDFHLWPLQEAGAFVTDFKDVDLAVPEFAPRGVRDYFYRTHRKIIVVDDIAYSGGMNFSLAYCSLEKPVQYTDIHIRYDGPAALEFAYIIAETAMSLITMSRKKVMLMRAMQRSFLLRREFSYCSRLTMQSKHKGSFVIVLDSNPDKQRRHLQEVLLEFVSGAKDKLYFTTPYFLPPADVEAAMMQAAKRGVDVKILIAGKTDVTGIARASSWIFDKYLDAGIEVFQHYASEIHQKSITIDGEGFFLGSYNLDQISFKYNMETAVVIKDPVETKKLDLRFMHMCESSMVVTKKTLRALPPLYRLYQYWFFKTVYTVWE